MNKRLLQTGLFVSGVLLSQAVNSQIDVTSQYLINASFEDDGVINNPTMPTGWEHTSNSYGWCGVNGDGDGETKDGDYIFGIWGNSIDNFELFQIADLPTCVYKICFDIRVASNDSV